MRSAGIQIDALTEYMTLLREGEGTREARKKILTEQREHLVEKLLEMQKTLDILNKKIESYEDKMLKCEREINK
jgi:DNA-binding transcriptional MerR regulator